MTNDQQAILDYVQNVSFNITKLHTLLEDAWTGTGATRGRTRSGGAGFRHGVVPTTPAMTAAATPRRRASTRRRRARTQTPQALGAQANR
jgi:hypothetical protein